MAEPTGSPDVCAARRYRKRAGEAGRPVDGEFLGPILAALERVGEQG